MALHTPLFCTVITRNYLPYARVLMASVRRHCPESLRHVLLADVESGTLPEEADFVTHTWSELGLRGYRRRAFANSAGALCSMLKPAFMAWALRRTGAPLAIFVDADSCFYGPPTRLIEAAECAPCVLTPHILTPLYDVDVLRGDGAIARSGTYNSGLYTIRHDIEGLAIADWWAEGMWREVWHDQRYAWDQCWTPLVHQLFPATVVLADPTYNVAYWNLIQRPVTLDAGGRYMVAEAPLRHFHFSFFDPAHPQRLVSHFDEMVSPPNTAIARLCVDYATALRAADADGVSRTPYGFSRFRDGRPITNGHRDYFRIWLLKHGAEEDDPFDPTFDPLKGHHMPRLSRCEFFSARLWRHAELLTRRLGFRK